MRDKLHRLNDPDADLKVKEFLDSKYDTFYVKRDFQPTVKCNIIAVSRPIEEWDISITSKQIQEKIYNNPELIKAKIGSSKSEHVKWLSDNGLNVSYLFTQGLNKIFSNAIKIAEGIFVKSDNKYKKDCLKIKKQNDSVYCKTIKELPKRPDVFYTVQICEKTCGKCKHYNAENIVNEKFKCLKCNSENNLDATFVGKFINPPGINTTIFGYSGVGLKHYKFNKNRLLTYLPVDVQNLLNRYCRDEGDIIRQLKVTDKLAIQPGEFGFIIDQHRDAVSLKSKRRKLRKLNNSPNYQPILLIANFGEDWIIFDGRGLLREVRRRIIKSKDISITQLLEYFTADPVIYPNENIVSLSFAEGEIDRPTYELRHGKNLKPLLEKIKTNSDGRVGLLSIDLGVNSILAYSLSDVSEEGDAKFIQNGIIGNKLKPDDARCQFNNLLEKHDELTEKIKEDALKLLTDDQRNEIYQDEISKAEITKEIIRKEYSIPSDADIWNTKTGIADWLIENDRKDDAKIDGKGKNKNKSFVLYNSRFAKDFQPSLSESTNKALQEARWMIQRKNLECVRLAKIERQLCRTIVNKLIKDSKKSLNCNTIVVACENLNVNKSFFDNVDKKSKGWGGHFGVKNKNKWFIKAMHKAITDLPQNKGVHVFEVNPAYTSQTCNKCKFCNKNNRSREKFKCSYCHYEENADVNAAINIGNVVICGDD